MTTEINTLITGIAQPATDRMNRTEARYAREHLEPLRLGGAISEYAYEAEKLRLADRTWYTPDFRIVRADGVIEHHEVKGHWEDDARVKIKAAAEAHPYVFRAVQRASAAQRQRHGEWIWESFPPRAEESWPDAMERLLKAAAMTP